MDLLINSSIHLLIHSLKYICQFIHPYLLIYLSIGSSSIYLLIDLLIYLSMHPLNYLLINFLIYSLILLAIISLA